MKGMAKVLGLALLMGAASTVSASNESVMTLAQHTTKHVSAKQAAAKPEVAQREVAKKSSKKRHAGKKHHRHHHHRVTQGPDRDVMGNH